MVCGRSSTNGSPPTSRSRSSPKSVSRPVTRSRVVTLSRSSRPIVRGYHSSSHAAVTSSTSLAPDSLATSTTARGSSTSATTTSSETLSARWRRARSRSASSPASTTRGRPSRRVRRAWTMARLMATATPARTITAIRLGMGNGRARPIERAPLAEQAAQREVEQGDEAARGQREPGGPGQDRRPTQARLALVEPTEVEGEDEDQGGDAEREQVGAQRVRRPRWGAVAHHHAQHRQPEDRQRRRAA